MKLPGDIRGLHSHKKNCWAVVYGDTTIMATIFWFLHRKDLVGVFAEYDWYNGCQS